ncbi:hypothetical protein ACFY3N_19885 [Streptomyces sp. NPDC000348]|uniref:hypothetical protein n=1 Tax=Streptomyces sp. NPDC000348 TaxID=3364538 RepID=UPI003683E834
MTSENVAEQDSAESAAAVSAKPADDQSVDGLVSRAEAEGAAAGRRGRAARRRSGGDRRARDRGGSFEPKSVKK